MTDREIMQQALDALKTCGYRPNEFGGEYLHYDEDEVDEAIAAMTERLAHCDRCGKKLGGEGDIHTCSPKQEPVDGYIASIIACREALDAQPVPPRTLTRPDTTPPAAQRQPLTDEEIKDVAASCMWWVREQDILEDAIELARAIEAAHGIKEKNT